MGGSLKNFNSSDAVAVTNCLFKKKKKIKVLAIIALFVSAASAFVVPLPVGAQVKTIKQCDGFEGPMKLISGDFPETINLPSKIPLNFVSEISEDLPADLIINMKLVKHSPYPLDVPCFGGVGSCEYDGCKVISENPSVCKTLPANVKCACPFPKGRYDFTGAYVDVPDMGASMDKLMVGHYTAKMTAYGKSNKSKIVGCFDLEFTFTH